MDIIYRQDKDYNRSVTTIENSCYIRLNNV